ncbi:MAG: hypothetical protein LBS30_06915, partial [Planctomycetota bacterium]|nr:hypothetical protein [Planctomycetota bacterium]
MTDTTDDLKTPPRTVEIKPLADKVNFEIAIPGSKSIANRVLLTAGMAEGASVAAGIPDSDDTWAALSVLEHLGVKHERL